METLQLLSTEHFLVNGQVRQRYEPLRVRDKKAKGAGPLPLQVDIFMGAGKLHIQFDLLNSQQLLGLPCGLHYCRNTYKM